MSERPAKYAHPPDKTLLFLLLLAATGLLLLYFGTRSRDTDSIPNGTEDAAEAYLAMTERKLCETVARIRGAGTVTVFVTPESTLETVSVPAPDEKAAFSGAAGEAKEKTVRRVYPKIGGVLVVCTGGADSAVAAEIKSAVSVALGISKNKIYVTSGVG